MPALSDGMSSNEPTKGPEIIIQAKEEIVELRSLRHTYQNLYRETADESLAQRIREGIKNKEWAFFS